MIGRKIAYILSSVSDCYKNIKYEEIITEEVGFEPTEDLHPRWFSRPVP